ncbi:MAG: translation initiation factor IF-2 [Capsulimonas sp.]|uniref:translation initiation factor IF-2 n=1 Tax=Capsulimonas sp. TaxID=2494211 RepID=UPI0032646946
MSGVRIYDLAKELKLTSNELLDVLKELGEPTKTASSTINDSAAEGVRKRVADRANGVSNGASAPSTHHNGNGSAPKPAAATAAPAAESPAASGKVVDIPSVVSLKDFADLISIPAPTIQKKLMGLGVLASLNQKLSPEVVTRLAKSYGVPVNIVAPQAAPAAPQAAVATTTNTNAITPAPQAVEAAPAAPAAPKVAVVAAKPRQKAAGPVSRPPVVTIMGHVDHGKTTLLDAIRKARVVDTEHGGITQHIGAYQVSVEDPTNAGVMRKITFLDTPGHEAFSAMRARGAQVTDIAILVVAADDGIMPQTIEAINHIKAAGVPMIVAVNKIDKDGANPTRVLTQLTEHNVMPEAYGGDVQTVELSAKEGLGLDDLLEKIILVTDAEIEPKADPSAPATGWVIEAEIDKGRGVVTTILVDQGTVKMGDSVVAGTTFGRIKAMVDDMGQRIKDAPPAFPVVILGLNGVPKAGDRFEVAKNEKIARQIAEGRASDIKEDQMGSRRVMTLEDMQRHFKATPSKTLNLIVKGDVQGSVEAIQQSLEKIDHPEVKVKFIGSGVGSVGDSDVQLAAASSALILAFNVRPEPGAVKMAEAEHVDIREYRIIYDLFDDVKKAMANLLDPIYEESALGVAEVRAVFRLPRSGGSIAGSYILDGKVVRNANVRVKRGGKLVAEGKIDTLKREKDDAREVAQGYECGILVPGYDPVIEDRIECYELKRIERTL